MLCPANVLGVAATINSGLAVAFVAAACSCFRACRCLRFCPLSPPLRCHPERPGVGRTARCLRRVVRQAICFCIYERSGHSAVFPLRWLLPFVSAVTLSSRTTRCWTEGSAFAFGICFCIYDRSGRSAAVTSGLRRRWGRRSKAPARCSAADTPTSGRGDESRD